MSNPFRVGQKVLRKQNSAADLPPGEYTIEEIELSNDGEEVLILSEITEMSILRPERRKRYHFSHFEAAPELDESLYEETPEIAEIRAAFIQRGAQ